MRVAICAILLAATLAALALPAVAADPEAGKAVFSSNCSVCHADKAGLNKIGPSLAGVYGRTAGSLPGYAYSGPMKSFAKSWDETTLGAYLANPKALVPGTKMAYPGLHDPQKVQAVIAYLQTLK